MEVQRIVGGERRRILEVYYDRQKDPAIIRRSDQTIHIRQNEGNSGRQRKITNMGR
jgi:hypothetical protein